MPIFHATYDFTFLESKQNGELHSNSFQEALGNFFHSESEQSREMQHTISGKHVTSSTLVT